MICYLSRNYKGIDNAGNKAKTDIEEIMDGLCFKNVGLKRTFYTNSVAAFFFTFMGILKFPFNIHKGDVLILQYPLKKYYTYVCRLAHIRGCKVVTVIHDLGSFRRKRLTTAKEINRLMCSDYIISHNAYMKQWLQDKGCDVPLGELEIFDYLSESNVAKKEIAFQLPCKVLYVGALASKKNNFLYKMENYVNSYKFALYGSGFELESIKEKERFIYRGFLPFEKLISTVDGDFGLVWDGDSIEACTGNFGEYLRYNNPHKTSLYIRCGLPVIIWEKAAMASFVSKHKIGFCIASLDQLDKLLASVSQDEYAEMKANVLQIGDRLSQGFYFSKAINKAIQSLK
ncbi:galactofuranosyltransferase [uncultured Bacteroides sp.]|uniref:galactofuranosyltransferase n=1 Tax=uncultured Bacteroides sp. TaxID=162156 RepID=UPI002AAA8A54|nr:galactofuranosyltransferase [uncultured Bacteroides sp.]